MRFAPIKVQPVQDMPGLKPLSRARLGCWGFPQTLQSIRVLRTALRSTFLTDQAE
jgi:hypothetical protein